MTAANALLDRSISTRAANLVAVPLFGLALVAPAALYTIVWRRVPYEGFDTLMSLHWGLLIGLLAASIIVHELLHGAAFHAFGRVPWHAIRFGIQWSALTPFANTSAPMPARSYRAAIVAPGLVLGALPIVAAVLLRAEPLLWYGAIMLGMASGDAIALSAMRGVPSAALVVDRPDRVGCTVVAS